MSRYYDGISDDENFCVWCSARLDEWKYSPGARVCLTCAVTGGPDPAEQKVRRCECGAELSRFSEGPICDDCNQKGVKSAVAWLADVDWAQPGYPTAEDKAEYEAWLDTMNGRLNADHGSGQHERDEDQPSPTGGTQGPVR